MNNKFNSNKILFSGGMILEVILMISIIMMMYPIINQQTIKRKTKLRDMLIVKEISTIKQVFERFLLKYVESFPKNTTCNISLSNLKSECKKGKIIPPEGFNSEKEFLEKVYSMGLPVGLGKGTNMLGQKYSVRVRRKSIKKSNVDVVEAIVIASGDEEVEDVTIRSIVRELGFSGGYIESNAIIGMNWFDTSNWKYSKEDGKEEKFGDGTLINKLNPVRADKSLLVKYKTTSVLDNTMQTDMLLNNKDIKRVNKIDTKSGQYVNLKADNINIEVGNEVDFQIDDKIKVNDGITYDNVYFDLGFTAQSGRVRLTGQNDNLKFARDLIVQDLYVKSTSNSPSPVKVTELKVAQIDVPSGYLDFQVNGVLNVSKINATSTGKNDRNEDKLKINSLYASTIGTIGDSKKAFVKYGEVFARFDLSKKVDSSPVASPCSTCILYLAKDGKSTGGDLSKFKDLVVSELNRKLDGVKLGKSKGKNGQKYDGVIVRYDTTLGEILTNLELEQQMVQKAIEKYFNPNWGGF